MKRRWPLIAGLAVVIVIAAIFWSRDATRKPQESDSNKIQVTKRSDDTVAKLGLLREENVRQENEQPDPYQNEAIRAQMMQVADLYEQTSKYPHFSQPILNPDQVKEPEPYTETEVDIPYPQDSIEEPIRLLAAVDRYQYFSGEIISVRLQILGAPADTFVQANAVISSSQGDTPFAATLNPTDATLAEFVGTFNTGIVPPGTLSTENMVKLQVTIGDKTLFTTVPFRYAEAAAQLVAIPYVRPEAEYLLIPLQFAVFSPGYYFTSAVLEDAESGRPLLRLQAEGTMQQGNGVLTLKAHSQALRAMGSEGPYILRSIQTYRGAEDGEAFDVPAANAQQRFEIQGFAFDQYDDTPYQDELAAERIEFLRNLGATNPAPEPSE